MPRRGDLEVGTHAEVHLDSSNDMAKEVVTALENKSWRRTKVTSIKKNIRFCE